MDAAAFVLLLPVAALAVLCALSVRRPALAVRLGFVPIAGTLIAALLTLGAVAHGGPIRLTFSGGSVVFYIDRLSAVMMAMISAVGAVVYRFSIRYMFQEPGYVRFHVLLVLTTTALLGMVSSSNLVMLFVFWQLLSWFLYFLAHHHDHEPTLDGAFKTFTFLRIGDVAFLAGIVAAKALYGTVEFQPLFERVAQNPVTVSLLPGLDISGATAVTLLLFVGGMTKSAQFPLHVWLPRSLYAPTPVHALLHAGIINAGGFLINRLAPLYGQSPATLHVALAVGALTAVLAASTMLAQNDIKRTLGFSTIGQMGYMILECGLGAFALAIFHLIAHGLFKATVFLYCGNVVHKARREPIFPHAGHVVEYREFSFITWSTGFLATLILPLAIVLAAHGVLKIPLHTSQGLIIFLFFSWVTSSQAILSLYRLRAVASWKVALTMFTTLVFVVFTYLFAAEAFTEFLYPAPGEAAFYFRAAAIPGWLFDTLVGVFAASILASWYVFYAEAHGRSIWLPTWTGALQVRLYMLFMNRLYVDAVVRRLGAACVRVAEGVDRRYLSWLP
jgi:NADH-quinone oxidoreductase subunit L